MYKAYMLGNTFLNDQVCFSFVPPPWKKLEAPGKNDTGKRSYK